MCNQILKETRTSLYRHNP